MNFKAISPGIKLAFVTLSYHLHLISLAQHSIWLASSPLIWKKNKNPVYVVQPFSPSILPQAVISYNLLCRFLLNVPCDPRSPLFLAWIWNEVISTQFVWVVQLCGENKCANLKGGRRQCEEEKHRAAGSRSGCSRVLGRRQSYSTGEPLQAVSTLPGSFSVSELPEVSRTCLGEKKQCKGYVLFLLRSSIDYWH